MSVYTFLGPKGVGCGGGTPGSAAATFRADVGADVIKIEQSGVGVPWRGRTTNPNAPTDYYWQLTSRNKRSLAIDLMHDEGRAALHKLVSGAVVFVTNFPLPVRERLGLAHTQLLPLNPRLIYASFTAYAERGWEAA